MKRILTILVIALIVLMGAMAVIPLFFKGAIVEKVKNTINQHISGKVNFEDFHISLFTHFPKVELGLTNLSLIGKDEFSRDTLVSSGSIKGTITLAELFRNKELQIKDLTIKNTYVLLKALKNGKVNWDIAPAQEASAVSPAKEQSSPMKIRLDHIELKNFNLKYLSEEIGLNFALKNLQMVSNGNINGSVTNFDLNTQANEMQLTYNSVQYISNLALKGTTRMTFDYDKLDFHFDQGKLWLNDLLLNFGGQFAMPSDSMYFDLNISNDSKDFNSLLALVPKDYKSYLEKVKAEGSATLNAHFKGWYNNDNYPSLDFITEIDHATFKYADFPESIRNINLKFSVTKPQGDFDKTVLDISQASAEVKNTPVKFNLKVATPVSDPSFAGSIAGKIDFNDLGQAIPLKDTQIQGKISVQLELEGKQSDIEKGQYDKFKSNGQITFDHITYQSGKLKKPLLIESGTVAITTPKIELKTIQAGVGQSKFQLNGQVSNYLLYALKNQTMSGDFTLISDFVDLTELATLQINDTVKTSSSTTKTAAPADSILAFEVPDKLDLKFHSSIKRAQFDQMKMENINGLIAIQNRKLSLNNLDMNILQGKLILTGSYMGNVKHEPDFDFSFNVANADISSAYQSLSIMRHYLPVAAKSQGKISSAFSLKGKMNKKLEPIPSTLDANGMLNTQNLKIIDSPTFEQLKGVIKNEKLKNIEVKDFTTRFEMVAGNLLVKPFNTMIADQEVTIQGKVSVSGELDFLMDFKLNRNDFGGDINKVLSFIPGSDNIKKVDVGVKVAGPLKDPKVSVDLNKAKDQILDEVKKAGTKEIQDKLKKIGNQLKDLFK